MLIIAEIRVRPIEAIDQSSTLDLICAEASPEIATALEPLFTEYGISGDGLFEVSFIMVL